MSLKTASQKMWQWLIDAYRREPVRAWLCLVAFAVSFGYALVYRIQPAVDARKFNDIAINLVTKHTFCYECNVPLAQDGAIRDIGPGYQFFLAGIYEIFGIHVWVVWFIQAVMQAIVVAWIWSMLNRALRGLTESRLTRLIPVGLYAVHPDIVQNNAMLMADGLFTFLLVASVMVFLPYVVETPLPRGWKRPAALGTLLGLMAMVRPTGLPIFVIMLLVLAWKRLWKSVLITLCLFVAVQTPWAIRNALTYHHFIYNSVVGGLDIWVGLYPKGSGDFEMNDLPEIAQRVQGLTPDETDRVSMEEVKKIIVEHPVFAVERTASKFFKLFALSKTSGFWFHYRNTIDHMATLVFSVIFNLFLLGFAGAAVVYALWKRVFRNPMLWVALAAILLLSVAPTISVVVNRYRIPMLPFVTVLAAYWLAAVRTRRERLITLGGSLAFFVLCTGIDVSGSWGKFMEHVSQFRS